MNKAKRSFKAVRKIIETLSDGLNYPEYVEFIDRIHGLVQNIEASNAQMEAEVDAEEAKKAQMVQATRN